MLRTTSPTASLWEAILPAEVLGLPTELARGVPEVSPSRRPLVFVDQSTEDVAAAQLTGGGRTHSTSSYHR
jgi:hypothetical protein